ncbi:Golgi-associated plant pathogenesis-related protein 1-like [Drosophila miranda]|uniref:Golgi-associated plant pathogenesis-related protein 1-like n=1 Tax=Drosophila miranda TaxID=7229 RepID=UPI0007E8AF85|nr:Golgi-associated plant pathogenesis-related protein 1-like [Drosophila miranda]
MVKIILILLAIYGFAQIDGGFPEDALARHNEHRKNHGCPDLKLDSDLSNECEAYAKTLAGKGKLEPTKLDGYTENLCMTIKKPLECIESWYMEKNLYDYNAPRLSSETEHFTAMIWKASNTLGIGLFTKDENHYVVARYKPKGNIKSEFKENIPKATGNADHSKSFCLAVLILVAVFIERN